MEAIHRPTVHLLNRIAQLHRKLVVSVDPGNPGRVLLWGSKEPINLPLYIFDSLWNLRCSSASFTEIAALDVKAKRNAQ
jgi:hypothetical protein